MELQDAVGKHSPPQHRMEPSILHLAGLVITGCVLWWGCRTVLDLSADLSVAKSRHSARNARRTANTGIVSSPTNLDVDNSHSLEKANSIETKVLGEWRDHYRGERTMVLNEDGTGTMVVVLAGLARKLFAERLEFEMEWSIDGDQITMTMISGEPANKYAMIRKLYGDEAVYTIVSAQTDLLHLKDLNGKTEYEWRRPQTMYEEIAADDR